MKRRICEKPDMRVAELCDSGPKNFKTMKHFMRTLALVLAMIAGGAGSAAAQTDNDYFSVTKDAGTAGASTSYHTTFDGALEDAANGDLITLLKDYPAPGEVSINKSITLDLNDHTITGDVQGHLISVSSGKTLEIVDNGTDTGKKGTITNNSDNLCYAIRVDEGGMLKASGGEHRLSQ